MDSSAGWALEGQTIGRQIRKSGRERVVAAEEIDRGGCGWIGIGGGERAEEFGGRAHGNRNGTAGLCGDADWSGFGGGVARCVNSCHGVRIEGGGR